MCEVHDKVTGRDAIRLLAKAEEGTLQICQKRENYLRARVQGFTSWLAEKMGAEDAKERVLEFFVLDKSKIDSDHGEHQELVMTEVNNEKDEDGIEYRVDEEAKNHKDYWDNIDERVERKFKNASYELSKEKFEKAEKLVLALTAPWVTGKYPIPVYRKLLAVQKRVHHLNFNAKILKYEHWAYLTNLINGLLGGKKKMHPCKRWERELVEQEVAEAI